MEVERIGIRLAGVAAELKELAQCPYMCRLCPGFPESMRDYSDALLREAHDLLATSCCLRGGPPKDLVAAISYRLDKRLNP